MEDDIVILNCQNCGEEFLYQTHKGRGSKNMAKYCDKCRVLKQNEYRKAYRERQKSKRHARKEARKLTNKELEDFAIKEVTKTIPIVASEEVVVDDYTKFIQTISELLMTLDTTRVRLCEVAKQMSEYQSGYDKSDQTYLHKLENLNTEDMADMKRFVVEWKTSRGARRNVKDLITLVGSVIDAIPFKSYANASPVLKGSAFKPKL